MWRGWVAVRQATMGHGPWVHCQPRHVAVGMKCIYVAFLHFSCPIFCEGRDDNSRYIRGVAFAIAIAITIVVGDFPLGFPAVKRNTHAK
jgi:hypothetical protein